MKNVSERAPFISRQIIHFDMLDAQGILHNAAYIVLLERARTEFWASHGYLMGDTTLDWPYYVVRHEITYFAPVETIGTVEISVSVAALGRTSLTYTHELIRQDGTKSAEARTVIVRVDAETRRPIPWSEAFRALITPYVASQKEE